MPTSLFIFCLALLNGALAQTITYMWVGPSAFPQKYKQKLLKLTYPYELIIDPTCEILIDKMEQVIGRRFVLKSMKYNRLSDLCRYAYIYFNGGTYSDLDVELDYDCYSKAIENSVNQWPRGHGQANDNYFFYEKQKYSANLLWLTKNIDAHSQLSMINGAYKNLPGFNSGNIYRCIKHSFDSSFTLVVIYSYVVKLIPEKVTLMDIWQVIMGLILIKILLVLVKIKNKKSQEQIRKSRPQQFITNDSLDGTETE